MSKTHNTHWTIPIRVNRFILKVSSHRQKLNGLTFSRELKEHLIIREGEMVPMGHLNSACLSMDTLICVYYVRDNVPL